jgi:adenylosuccinate synthase
VGRAGAAPADSSDWKTSPWPSPAERGEIAERSTPPHADLEIRRTPEDVGHAGREYRALYDIRADIRAQHGPEFLEEGAGGVRSERAVLGAIMRWDRKAVVLVGLGFGDESKGAWTDYFARTEPVHTVVRFNGGAQAGHNVVTPDGRHHTFAQFGSGTLVPGVNTHLSRFMLVNPFRLLQEDDALKTLGVSDALRRTSIDRRALITTPFQVAANRLRELARGDARHGSCGMGIGETMSDWLVLGAAALTAGDLADARVLTRKLAALRDLKIAQLADVLATLPDTEPVARERAILFDPSIIETCARVYQHLARSVRLVNEDHLGELLRLDGTVVFEGAQGVLLDEWRGFHPYTTWSTTTFENALTLLHEQAYDAEVVKIGLLRAYSTRHGAGPFVTEDSAVRASFSDAFNVQNDWQQSLRVGPFDAVAARYAVDVAGTPDLLAISHLDQLAQVTDPQMAVAYRCSLENTAVHDVAEVQTGQIVRLRPAADPHDLAHQERLTEVLTACAPVYRAAPQSPDAFAALVEDMLNVPVGLVATGPSARDRQPRGDG